jgi:hypothetical protein
VGDGKDTVPQVLVQYPGPDPGADVQDIFVYLRPETNGVLVESTLLRVVQGCEYYRNGISLIYLANVPGQFILDHHVVEQHYSHKLFFAVHGKRAFTAHMRDAFENHFRESWQASSILGSYEALYILNLTPEELFSVWVPRTEIMTVDGQTIKKIGDNYVVNYDIPALLQKNNRATDIAVMLFRSRLDYGYFESLVREMQGSLVEQGILDPDKPPTRVFHYSRGPFEQVLDATDYLYGADGPVPLEALTFVQYAAQRGYSTQDLMNLVKNPICLFGGDDGSEVIEENILNYTMNDTYPEAIDKLATLRAQLWIRRYA